MTEHAEAQAAADPAAAANPPVVDAEAQAATDAATAKKTKAEKPPKPPKEPRATLQEANGVTRPADPLSKTGQVWAMADKLSREAGRPIERKAVMEALKSTINLATIATQYGKWRHFNGLKGVKIEVPKPPAPPAAAANPEQGGQPAPTPTPPPTPAPAQPTA